MKKPAILTLFAFLSLVQNSSIANASLIEPTSSLPTSNITQSLNLQGGSYDNLAEWFEGEITYPIDPGPHADYFAPYDFQAVGENLYVGIGISLPAEYRGAVIGKFNSTYQLNHVYSPTEDSFHDMDLHNGKIYIPGTDPGYMDGQDAGNEYVIDTSDDSVVKMRYNPNTDPEDLPYLPAVIHSWGHWINPETGVLYVTTGSAGGSSMFKSTTSVDHPNFLLNNFTPIANLTSYHVGSYRAMDIIGFDGYLFASSRSGGVPSESSMKLFISDDDGETWSEVSNVFPEVYSQFLIHDDKLIIVGVDYSKFYVFTEHNQFETYTFDDFEIANIPLAGWSPRGFVPPHPLVSVGKYLYLAAADNSIYRTVDFTNWEKVTTLSDDISTIEYWPAKDQLVIGTYGTNSSIQLVDLSELITLSGVAFNDINNNNVKDSGEYGLENLNVKLFAINPEINDIEVAADESNLIRELQTDEEGGYFLDLLMGNSYQLQISGDINGVEYNEVQDIDLELGSSPILNQGIFLGVSTPEEEGEEEAESLPQTGRAPILYMLIAIVTILSLFKAQTQVNSKK